MDRLAIAGLNAAIETIQDTEEIATIDLLWTADEYLFAICLGQSLFGSE